MIRIVDGRLFFSLDSYICYILIYGLLLYCSNVFSGGCVESDDKTLETLLIYYLLYFYYIRKDPAIKRTSYLKSQRTITYIPILTLFILCVPCTFNFRTRYSSIVCHSSRALDTYLP
jgi:hypothetical protein